MAVLRHLIARLSAETSGFQAGMKGAQQSLRQTTHDVRKFSDVLSREMLRGLTPVQKAKAVVEEMRRSHLQAAFAEKAHAEQAKQLTRTIEELAEAERNSIAIAKQSATVHASVAGGGAGGLVGFNKLVKLARGGGILVGTKLLTSQLAASASEAERLSIAIRTGEEKSKGYLYAIGKSLPLIGDSVSFWESIAEIITGAKAEAEKLNQIFIRGNNAVGFANRIQFDLQQARAVGAEKEINAIKEKARQDRSAAIQAIEDLNDRERVLRNIKEIELIEIKKVNDAEREKARQFLRDEKKRAEAAAKAGDEYRRQIIDAREADRKARVAETTRRVGGADDRFREEQRLIKIIAEANEKKNKKEISKSASGAERSLQSASFGSSGAAATIARVVGSGQFNVLTELRAIRKAIMEKSKHTITVKELNR